MTNNYITPEGKARINIDKNLNSAGWLIQNKDSIDLSAGIGVAVREFPTDSGPADYILFVEKKPVGVIEAKRKEIVEEEQKGKSRADYGKTILKKLLIS